MKKLRIAYFGTPYFSAIFLDKFLTDASIKRLIEVKFVLTRSDKAVGRNRIIKPSPVKEVAVKHQLKVYDQNVTGLKEEINKVDFVLIYAYGFKQYIPKEILGLPKLKFPGTASGFINIHPSLLPLYRGSSPIAYPLLLGDIKTGVSLFVLDEKMDHGPILAKEELIITAADKRPDLEKKLTGLGYNLFKKLVIELSQTGINRLKSTPQDHVRATRARFLVKEDGFIELDTLKKTLNNQKLMNKDLPKILQEYYKQNNMAIEQFNNTTIFNLFRGLFPWPGLWTKLIINNKEKRLKITDITLDNEQFTINHVQLEGKKEVSFKTFNSAYRIF